MAANIFENKIRFQNCRSGSDKDGGKYSIFFQNSEQNHNLNDKFLSFY